MKVLQILLILFAWHAEARSIESQEEAIDKAAVDALKCSSPSDFDALFRLSASGEVTGVHPSEQLSEVNEEVFLKCPLEFLLALNAQPEATQASVVDLYFGIRHAPWELGAELRKWKHHKKVGALVRTRFAAFLEAQAEQ